MPSGLKSEVVARQTGDWVELASRLVYSLLKSAVRVAARFRLPIDRFVELSQLAYFEELRKRSPRDLRRVTEILGVSYRTGVTLNRRLKSDFFRPEQEAMPLRRITGLLLAEPGTSESIAAAIGDVDPAELDRALQRLIQSGWVIEEDGRYTLDAQQVRSFVSDDLGRRIDGLNHQMEIFADSVWARFVADGEAPSSGRTWVFAARVGEFAGFIDKTVRQLRHDAVELEETALSEATHTRFGVTVAFAPVREDEEE